MLSTNRSKQITGIFAAIIIGTLALSATASQKIRFSDAWKFYRGDAASAQTASFDDASWATVCLPHTVKDELDYRTNSIYMGVCWYRKSFTPPASYIGKKVYLEFEAAMQTAQVWINGTSLITHLGGYTPFVLDITSYIKSGTPVVIAARLDNNPSTSFPPGNPDPDFLYFGGLYRDVQLHVMDSLHITNPVLANIPGGGGVFVTYPSVSGSSATVQVKTHVLNEHAAAQSCVMTTTIVNADGSSAATNSAPAINIAPGAANTFTQSLTVANPKLWTPGTPSRYTVRSEVFVNGGSVAVDTMSTVIGIRSIAFSKANGLQINGTRQKLRGCNRHMSYPYIGNAVPKSGQYRDALRIKQYGYDFVRMSHYMQPESFVDACDKLGIAGMACLPGWQYYNDAQAFRDNSIKALRDMIRVYRNHPSVIIYEAMHNESSPTSAFLTAVQAAADEEYPGNQMYTCGEEETGILDVYMSSAQHDVRNYTGSRACVISEFGDWEHGCVYAAPITGCKFRIDRSAGETALRTMATTRANDLSLNRGCSWFTMDGVWTVFDYQSWSRGPYTTCGDMDIFRIPKYPAYSTAGPGTAIATASGSPSKVKIEIDTADLLFAADGSDIAIVYASLQNNSGQLVATATSSVTFSISGPATLVGTNPVAAIAGIASILVRAGATNGPITVTGTATGIPPANATVTSHAPAGPIVGIASLSYTTQSIPLTDGAFTIYRNGNTLQVRFPNPAANATDAATLTLFDAKGRAVDRWSLTNGRLSVDIRMLPHGIYFAQVSNPSYRSVCRVALNF